MAIKHGEWRNARVIFDKAYALCDDSSYFSLKQRHSFMHMERYYYQIQDSLQRALQISTAYQYFLRKLTQTYTRASPMI